MPARQHRRPAHCRPVPPRIAAPSPGSGPTTFTGPAISSVAITWSTARKVSSTPTSSHTPRPPATGPPSPSRNSGSIVRSVLPRAPAPRQFRSATTRATPPSGAAAPSHAAHTCGRKPAPTGVRSSTTRSPQSPYTLIPDALTNTRGGRSAAASARAVTAVPLTRLSKIRRFFSAVHRPTTGSPPGVSPRQTRSLPPQQAPLPPDPTAPRHPLRAPAPAAPRCRPSPVAASPPAGPANPSPQSPESAHTHLTPHRTHPTPYTGRSVLAPPNPPPARQHPAPPRLRSPPPPAAPRPPAPHRAAQRCARLRPNGLARHPPALLAGGLALLAALLGVSLHETLTRPLQTLSNVVAALREDDFSSAAPARPP